MYQVKEVADITGVSVRTLHHYDKIGLLKPSQVGTNGYRLYDEQNLAQLQQILFFKELDFSLQQVKEILNDEHFDQKKALLNHRKLLEKKKHRLDQLIKTIDDTYLYLEEGKMMNHKKMFESFDMSEINKHQEKYAEEVKERWGHTDAYKQSQKRASSYNEEDWKNIQQQSNSIYERLAAMKDSNSPSDQEVQLVIGEWHQLITENFYDCPPEMFKGLGEMYVQDTRFTKNIDKYGEGLAVFMRDAMRIYSDRLSNSNG